VREDVAYRDVVEDGLIEVVDELKGEVREDLLRE
jgi:hypothetical protein